MKIGMAISAVILLVLGVAVYLKLQPLPADKPTPASADDKLAVQTLADNLPTFQINAAPGTPDIDALFDAALDADRFVKSQPEDDTIDQTYGLITELRRSGPGDLPEGFLDQHIPANEFESDYVNHSTRALRTIVQIYVQSYIEADAFDEARVVATAYLLLGRQVFENNVRLKARQHGLNMMRGALAELGKIATEQEADGGINTAQLAAIRNDLQAWHDAVGAVHGAWSDKLKSIGSTKPNIGDLVRVAENDKDRSFRIYATLRLGFAKWMRGEPGNQQAIADALERAKASDDAMIRAAAGAAEKVDKEQFHENLK